MIRLINPGLLCSLRVHDAHSEAEFHRVTTL